MMVTELIKQFMREEYAITPSENSIFAIKFAGFEKFEDEKEQLDNLIRVQRETSQNGLDNLVAKIFSLAYPYKTILNEPDNELIKNWSGWLGSVEYKLGRLEKRLLFKLKLFKKSLEHLLVARNKGDDSKENAKFTGNCYFELGKCHYRSKKFKTALDYFFEARREGDGSKENASFIGNCYYRLKEYKQALDYFLEAREKGDDNKENAGLIGHCYYKLKKYKVALPYFLIAREKGDNSKENSSLIGNCYYQSRKYGKAMPFLIEAREKGDNSRENAVLLGTCYFGSGRFKEGLSEYERAIQLIKKEKFDKDWIYNFNLRLRFAHSRLAQSKDATLIKNFQIFYDKFVDYWKNNEPYKNFSSKLIISQSP